MRDVFCINASVLQELEHPSGPGLLLEVGCSGSLEDFSQKTVIPEGFMKRVESWTTQPAILFLTVTYLSKTKGSAHPPSP